MSSIFPFIEEQEIKKVKRKIPMAKEYAYDFEKGEFKLKDGKMYFVEGNEAIKIWIEKLLRTNRYKEIIHTWNYGSEIEDKLIGRGYSEGIIKSEAKRYIEESISNSLSDYVLDLRDFKFDYIEDKLIIKFTVETIYGEVKVDV